MFGEQQRRRSPARGLRQHGPCLRLGTRSQYPWDLVRLGIEAPLRTPLRRVPPLLTLVCCPGWLKSRGRPRGRAWERSPSKGPVVCRLSPGQDGQSGNVPARSRKAGDEPVANRISIIRHDNGNRGSCFLGGWVTVGPVVTMTSTLRRTSSAASAGRRSSFPSACRYSMTMFFPSTTRARADPAGMLRCGPRQRKGK